MTPALIPSVSAPGRIRACIACQDKCRAWREENLGAIYGACAQGNWSMTEPGTKLTPSTATDHEHEASKAGYVPSCCGSAALKAQG